MSDRLTHLDTAVGRVIALLASVEGQLASERRAAALRWQSDAQALTFHLGRIRGRAADRPLLVAIIGGTGTGKSTLLNRLLGVNLSAASFRRTFTTGPIAAAPAARAVPEGWPGIQHIIAPSDGPPARGQAGALVVAEVRDTGTGEPLPTLIDTPDLDGDQPAHHAQADRIFRWADAVVFLVTPEKYQMTELLPYYRLAGRYALPVLYVMNKCEEDAVVEDFRKQLKTQAVAPEMADAAPRTEPRVFAVQRDDAGYEPPADMGLAALRAELQALRPFDPQTRLAGLRHRAADVLGRLADQILAPLQEDRAAADEMIAALRAMETPPTGVDVNPLTQQLQRRLQQRSILYLIGPQRVLDRVRQAPVLLARLPRAAWDYLRRGEMAPDLLNPTVEGGERKVPDFPAILVDQFAVVQSRIDDVLRSTPVGQRWVDDSVHPFSAARIDPSEAARIASEELADLKNWLEKKWNATPRDTRLMESVLKRLPGGKALAKWSEASPYLLTLILVTHGAVFGHHDLIILGGYSLFAWLTERLSNEVKARTRTANARIEQRFSALAHEQINRACEWLDRLAPSAKLLTQLEQGADDIGNAAAL